MLPVSGREPMTGETAFTGAFIKTHHMGVRCAMGHMTGEARNNITRTSCLQDSGRNPITSHGSGFVPCCHMLKLGLVLYDEIRWMPEETHRRAHIFTGVEVAVTGFTEIGNSA